MRNLIFAGACLLTTALAGCQQNPPANDQLDAVLWTQTSIEHELVYRQLFANATRQLDVALSDPTWDALPFPPRNLAGLPPAVVVDIDETLLDNVPLNARDIINNQVYSYDRWNTWVDQACRSWKRSNSRARSRRRRKTSARCCWPWPPTCA